MLLDPVTTIGKLRVGPARLDALSMRLRLERRLAHATLRPRGLAAHAIICVRRFRDPAQHLIAARAPDGAVMQRWEQGVRDALDRLMTDAARPRHGFVPASAQAVIFESEAELLACLARDWCVGLVSTSWWWQSLFGAGGTRYAPAKWLESPRIIPDAFALLAQMDYAHAFVSRLDADLADLMLSRICAAFSLPHIARALAELNAGCTTSAGAANAAPDAREFAGPAQMLAQSAAAIMDSWLQVVPEAMQPGLDVPQRRLLAISLLLVRRAQIVRAPEYAAALVDIDLLDQKANHADADDERVDLNLKSFAPLSPVIRPDSPNLKLSPSAEVERHTDPPALATTNLVAEIPSAKASEPARVVDRASLATEGIDQTLRALIDVKEAALQQAHPGDWTVPEVSHQAFETIAVDLGPLEQFQIETEFGGLFYLINLALYLELYGDFTVPNEPGIALSIWNFVALVSHRLLGAELAADPIWQLLAQLAQRTDDEPIGGEFQPPEDWHLPQAWLVLQPFGNGAGILLDAEPTANGEQHGNEAASVTRWLDQLMPFIHVRLQRALGADNFHAGAQTLLRARAQVFLTAGHLDVYFSLGELPIAVRLSGLDRDPGWVPAAARVIRFHYL